ncbi:MAG: hypothetical protein JSR37_06945 [Verrucomicrobia bacterium]|nr:hypothetical protein [Verrucomicrobiota bacterium]MBS0636402.1 hypothetical protein [Verrucomicrobiota bacterium]
MTLAQVDAVTFKTHGFHTYDYDNRSSIPDNKSLYRMGDRIVEFEKKPTAEEAAERFNAVFQEFVRDCDIGEHKYKPICVALRICNDHTIQVDPQVVIFGERVGKATKEILLEPVPGYPNLLRLKKV